MRLLLLLCVIVVAGCGPSGPRNMKVWGDVTYDGKPIETGDIIFTPQPGTIGTSTGAEIRGGQYSIPAKVGPLADGTYKVEIKALHKIGTTPNIMVADGPPLDLFENFIPTIYNAESNLSATISSDPAANQRNFHLKKPE